MPTNTNSDTYSKTNPDNYFYVNASIIESEIDLSSTVTMFNLIDLTHIEEFRQKYPKNRPSYTVFVAKALAMTLMEFPEMNKRFFKPFGIFPRVFQQFRNVDMAIASEVTDPKLSHVAYIGIMPDVQKKSLPDIQQWLVAFRDKDASDQWQIFSSVINRLPVFLSRWMIRLPAYFPHLWVKYRGGASIISSPSKYGVDGLVAAWSSPIGVSFGYVKARPIVKADKIVAVPSFYLTFNFDRRMISGAQGARFLARLSEVLETGEFERQA